MSNDLSKYQVELIECALIFCDHEFNCRGRIDRTTCEDLARDVKARGLDFPIHLQAYDLKPPFKYRIVSGHRRFTAFQINKETVIPAVVRTDFKNELEAREANLRENIQREDLNMRQEAEAISYFVTAGYPQSRIAERLGKSNGWVEVRRKLLHLPEFVQEHAAKGVIKQSHIHQLWEHRGNPDKIAELVRTIKERSESGERAIVLKSDIRITDFAKARRPKPHEVEEFMHVVAMNITNRLPETQDCFAHKCLAWVMGNISPAQAYAALKRECERLSLKFEPPAEIKRIFDGVSK